MGPGLHYSFDILIQMYAEPVPLKYGKLAIKYPWTYGYFYSVLAFQGENILQVELDMPNRTTRDYEGPSVAPKIQAVLDAALEDEGDIDIDDRLYFQ